MSDRHATAADQAPNTAALNAVQDPVVLQGTAFVEQARLVETKIERSDQRSDSDRIGDDRSFIGRAVVIGFLVAIALTIVLDALAAWAQHDWSKLALEIGDLLKTVLLPVVLLVLGFYFGQQSGKDGK